MVSQRKAEIRQVHLTRHGQQNVAWLNVTMYDQLLVDIIQSLCDCRDDPDGFP